MNCQQLIEILSDYLEGSMPADYRAELEKHLALCPPCIDYLNSFRDTIRLAKESGSALSDCGELQLPPELVKAIMDSCKNCKQS